MHTAKFFWLICGYCCKTMCKSSIWSNLFHLHVYQMSSLVVNVEWKVTKIRVSKIRVSEIKVSEIRVSEIKVSEIRVSKIRVSEISVREISVREIRISSNHRELHGAIFWTELHVLSFLGFSPFCTATCSLYPPDFCHCRECTLLDWNAARYEIALPSRSPVK